MKITESLKDLANYCGLGVEGERKSDPTAAFNEHTSQVTKGAVPLSDFLIYDYFDEEQGLFFNRNSPYAKTLFLRKFISSFIEAILAATNNLYLMAK